MTIMEGRNVQDFLETVPALVPGWMPMRHGKYLPSAGYMGRYIYYFDKGVFFEFPEHGRAEVLKYDISGTWEQDGVSLSGWCVGAVIGDTVYLVLRIMDVFEFLLVSDVEDTAIHGKSWLPQYVTILTTGALALNGREVVRHTVGGEHKLRARPVSAYSDAGEMSVAFMQNAMTYELHPPHGPSLGWCHSFVDKRCLGFHQGKAPLVLGKNLAGLTAPSFWYFMAVTLSQLCIVRGSGSH